MRPEPAYTPPPRTISIYDSDLPLALLENSNQLNSDIRFCVVKSVDDSQCEPFYPYILHYVDPETLQLKKMDISEGDLIIFETLEHVVIHHLIANFVIPYPKGQSELYMNQMIMRHQAIFRPTDIEDAKAYKASTPIDTDALEAAIPLRVQLMSPFKERGYPRFLANPQRPLRLLSPQDRELAMMDFHDLPSSYPPSY